VVLVCQRRDPTSTEKLLRLSIAASQQAAVERRRLIELFLLAAGGLVAIALGVVDIYVLHALPREYAMSCITAGLAAWGVPMVRGRHRTKRPRG
jgi:hypothetical protein